MSQTSPEPLVRRSTPRVSSRVDRRIAIVILGLFAGAMLLPDRPDSHSSAYWFIAWLAFILRTFQFHVGVLLGALAVALALRQRTWPRLPLVLASIVLLVPTLLETCRWATRTNATATNATTPSPLRVMTANLYRDNHDRARILGSIGSVDPDVLLLQEYAPWHQEALLAALRDRYPHRLLYPATNNDGLAIYSKLALTERRRPEPAASPPRRIVVAELQLVDGSTAALYCVHLHSPRTPARLAMNRRETDVLIELLREDLDLERGRGRVIVAGDFNFNERSPQFAALTAVDLREAHALAGTGRGPTWPAVGPLGWLPGVRIDHIFVAGQGSVPRRASTGERTGSDHLPSTAELVFEPRPQ